MFKFKTKSKNNNKRLVYYNNNQFKVKYKNKLINISEDSLNTKGAIVLYSHINKRLYGESRIKELVKKYGNEHMKVYNAYIFLDNIPEDWHKTYTKPLLTNICCELDWSILKPGIKVSGKEQNGEFIIDKIYHL